MNLEQRIRRLEEATSKRRLNEGSFKLDFKTIKYRGGTLRQFDRTDWGTWMGANPFPEPGIDPFIDEGVIISSKMADELESFFGEPFDRESVVIFDYSDNKYTISIQYFTDEHQPYLLIFQFSSFGKAKTFIEQSLGNEINNTRNINNIEAY